VGGRDDDAERGEHRSEEPNGIGDVDRGGSERADDDGDADAEVYRRGRIWWSDIDVGGDAGICEHDGEQRPGDGYASGRADGERDEQFCRRERDDHRDEREPGGGRREREYERRGDSADRSGG